MANQRGLLKNTTAPTTLPSTRASDYIANPLSRLPMSRKSFSAILEHAKQIANEVEEKELCPENMPPSLAAGVIAFVLGLYGEDEITSEQIAAACGVSEGTLQKCCKKLEASARDLSSLENRHPV